MFSMSPTWALFLGVCGLGVALVAARGVLGERGGSAVQAVMAGGVPLITGLLLGFALIAVPLPVLWVWAVVIAGMLLIHYRRQGRLAHVGLLAVGFGMTWTGLIGWRVWNDLTDPAVSGTGDSIGFLAVGIAILSGGIVTVAAALALPPTSPPRSRKPPPRA